MPAGRCAEKPDALRIDAEFSRLAAHELHGGHHVLYGLRKHFALGDQPIADGEQRNAARGEIWPPVLEGAARAHDPGAAVHGDERRCCLGAGGQIEIADQLDAVVLRVGDSGFGLDRSVRHFSEASLSCRAKKSSSSRLASSARSMLGQWPQLSSTCNSALRNFAASSLA